ncbi:hypothetical protein LV457_08365 [Mycobacterium sp. MYCO198283]|uniref:hypothetical protein n=1 Tax=Mycobacterium sp. MYCO198283 TaxID=2883505 RepID=UPI001E2C9CF4|nr:hypothetical protein [Mycobacterium sp. MYCO198283]MCG5432306.1 hypothetical protein [Mycobacterium sp. MYCO198283]
MRVDVAGLQVLAARREALTGEVDECTAALRASRADNVVIVELAVPTGAGVAAVSGSGLFRAGDREVRAQYNLYAIGSPLPGRGRLVQQCLYVDTAHTATFDPELIALGDRLHRAFVDSVQPSSL